MRFLERLDMKTLSKLMGTVIKIELYKFVGKWIILTFIET